MMKRLMAVAALLLATTSAQAQYTFEYGGRTIRIDPDRGTVSIPGVYDNSGRRAKRAKSDDAKHKQAPQQAKTDTQASPDTTQPTATAPAQPAPAAPAAITADPSTTTAAATPADNAATSVAPPPSAPAAAAPAPPPPAPTVAAVPPAPTPVAPKASPQAANTPIGVWLTEEKEGKVRIEQCGANLCGYSVDKKSNENGEQVLINMKPGHGKWSGRILDPSTGSTYDSTIALKGADTLRIQGCGFGGMFCGGQTWTRVN